MLPCRAARHAPLPTHTGRPGAAAAVGKRVITSHGVPRCPGDPNCPETNNPENVLDLVPPGLTPVKTFPPFNPLIPRTVPAVAVIFEEAPGTLPGERPPDTDGRDGTDFRKKRHASYCPQKSFLDKFLLNLRCYKERMKAKYKQNSHGKNFDINHY